ncbi:GTPase Era [Methylobacterium aerolatum]|uniref:GTPase Era n=1 Tax=Methylobacterium aerolatum TaxID=418708 RepID=A0ABU0HYY4_9HYPH|nr:GTPase Era [Methylobacterium aerolatum]MDQ0447564.1 GTP-binding protein Era [Methylobacterium aerolatum]GJD34665.1 GTPase Era [Methylobacterium aerolatum]
MSDQDDIPGDDGPEGGPAPAATSPTRLPGTPADSRAGFAALIGVPNAGKSTLLNSLVGTKVSIVSRKVQTTRALVRGIVIEGSAQIVLVDTPGIFAPKRRLDRAMVHSAWSGAADADAVCLLVDARKGVDEEVEAILARLGEVRREKLLILNKIDLIPRERLLALAAKLNEAAPFAETFMISALKGDGIEDLRKALAARMPPGPWLYPEDQVSDAPLRMLAAEITREKIYDRLHEELPYRSTVETDQWQVKADGSVRIEQTIFVERESQRAIVLGRNGQTIRSIGQAARVEIAEAAEATVHLFLHVKVRENWADDPARYREMGLEFPRG